MRQAPTVRTRRAAVHAALGGYTLVALLPVILIIMNSFKDRASIFSHPMMPPTAESFSLIGYVTVLKQGDFLSYFENSMIVTVGSIFFILLFGAMAAFALTEYRFRGNIFLGLFLALGVMVPIRLGTVAILEIMARSGL
ncbi:MAG TPA: carbohydrate ABC transporter permease, partial [Dongiaceae bacterium]|nr:carbohydrate ABC transporter permease [Dongiaceae bacterium]